MLAPSTTAELLDALRQRLLQWDSDVRGGAPTFSSGCTSLDAILPQAGLTRGSLVEYLAETGSGATLLALIAAREACRERPTLVVVDSRASFYPPAAANVGIDLSAVILLRPETGKDYFWALHQSLSCPAVGAVLSWPDKLAPRQFRSLQLAAESSGVVGILRRPLTARGDPTWSEVRFLVESESSDNSLRRMRVEVLRCRRGQSGASIKIELDDETGSIETANRLPMASSLAYPTTAARASGA